MINRTVSILDFVARGALFFVIRDFVLMSSNCWEASSCLIILAHQTGYGCCITDRQRWWWLGCLWSFNCHWLSLTGPKNRTQFLYAKYNPFFLSFDFEM